MQCQNLDIVFPNSIDDAVGGDHDLADVLGSQFRNNPAGAWIACQPVCGKEDPVGERRRQSRRIPANK